MARVDERAEAPTQQSRRPAHELGHDPTLLAAKRDLTPDTAGVRVNVIGAPGEVTGLAAAPKMTERNLRLPALFAGAGLLATTIVIGLAVKLRNPTVIAALEAAPTESAGAPRPASPGGSSAAKGAEPGAAATKAAPVHASPAEIERAQAGGLAALVSLSQRYPNDPALLAALVLAHGRERAYMAAMQATKRLFELAPDKTGNDDIRQLILRSANSTPDVAAVALELMARNMGSRGPDMLYEVVTVPQFGDYPKDKASKLLLDSGVRQNASPALVVADDLRRSTACPTKALIVKAGEQGDMRARQYLKQLLIPQRCGLLGFRNCLKCGPLQKDIRAAVAVIEKRRSDSQASPAPTSSSP